MPVFSLPASLAILGLSIASFWLPKFASWFFIAVFIVLLEGFSLLGILVHRGFKTYVDSPPYFFTIEEAELIKAFPEFFKHPWFSKECSVIHAATGIAAFIFCPILLYHGLYLEAAIIGLNWIPAMKFSHRLRVYP